MLMAVWFELINMLLVPSKVAPKLRLWLALLGEHPTFAKIRDTRQDRGVELSTPPMTPEDIERLQACSREIAEILYRNTPESELENLDGIEGSDMEVLVRLKSLPALHCSHE